MSDILHHLSTDARRARVHNLIATDDFRGAVAFTATLGLATACWVLALRQMSGMNVGVSTQLGSFGHFLAVWVTMMGAMMLPGAVPMVVRCAHSSGGLAGVTLFVGVYVAAWTAVGVGVYLVYRPHGPLIAGALVIAAGLYELTPFKSRCRQRCRQSISSGEFTLACIGSSTALMLWLVALGLMSVAWMSIIAVVVFAQKILPTKRVIDIPIALATVALGVLILLAPTSIPGLMPSGLMPSV